MHYKNGRDVLPPSLLRELQKYAGGELIYVPKAVGQRARWGEVSGTRKLMAERNEEIGRLYGEGWTVSDLEKEYHLSGESIRKIIVNVRRQTVGDGGSHAEVKYAP